MPTRCSESAQVSRFEVAALEARDLLREQRRDHRLAPQVGHLVAKVGRGEHLALERNGESNVANFADAQPRDGLGQRDHGIAARIHGGVRDAHHLAGERHVALNEPREIGGACVGIVFPGSFATRESHDFRNHLRRRRQLQGFIGHGFVKNAIDVVGGGRLRRAVHGLLIVVTRSVNGREFRHLTVICMPPPGEHA